MKKFSGWLVFLFVIAVPALAQTNAWQWQATLVPKARVFQGLWSEYYKFEPALHLAGLPYTTALIGFLDTTDTPDPQDSVIVLANVSAGELGAERLARLKDFVAAGGGLVVLGGENAFSQGGYADSPLADLLPVVATNWPHRLPKPAPLARAPSATWLPAADLSDQPTTFFIHDCAVKSNAVVQLLAGDKPAIVSGTYGKGRVLAVVLMVNGATPPGALPFWEWTEWPRLLGQMIDWAAGARPLRVTGQIAPPSASQFQPLTSDELADFALSLKTPTNLLERALAYPSAAVAEALFTYLTAPDATSVPTLAQSLPVLVPYAKPEWAPRLIDRTGELNPSHDDRRAALTLLGATRSPLALAPQISALDDPEYKNAAVEGLGYSGDPKAIPLLLEAYTAAIRAAQLPKDSAAANQSGSLSNDDPQWFNPGEFIHVQAIPASRAALALYRLGETNGVARVLAMNRHVQFYWDVNCNASRRAARDTAGVAFVQQCEADMWRLLPVYLALQHHDHPLPASQLAAFLKIAQTATDTLDVTWIVGEMESSLSAYPAATWQPLAGAKDNIVARFARAAVAETRP